MANWDPPQRPNPASGEPSSAGGRGIGKGPNLDGDARSWWQRKLWKLPIWGWLGILAGVITIGALGGTGDEQPVASNEFADLPDTAAPNTSPTVTSAQTSSPDSAPETTPTPTTNEPDTTPAPASTDPPSLPPVVPAAVSELAALRVADPDPQRNPYVRAEYDGDGWADFDSDCITTRHELLITYSLEEPVIVDACFVEAGRWIDPYGGSEYTQASQVTIDHVVPLAEAHRSGAWKWDIDTKHRFANDETPGHLLVIGADVNQSKADNTPDKWLPPDPAAHCQYAIDWITTKSRYELSVTAAERAALESALVTCTPSTVLRPLVDAPAPMVVITVPTTTTTTTIPPAPGAGMVSLLACDRYAEAVTIGNTGGQTISLSGHTLHDEGDKHRTSLGQFGSLAPGEQLRILTGPDAVDGDGQAVWKRQNVWNNDGDTAFLIAPDGSEQTERC